MEIETPSNATSREKQLILTQNILAQLSTLSESLRDLRREHKQLHQVVQVSTTNGQKSHAEQLNMLLTWMENEHANRRTVTNEVIKYVVAAIAGGVVYSVLQALGVGVG